MSPTLVVVVLLLVMLAGASGFAWIFRRFLVLFAALDATERIEDNAPTSLEGGR